MINPFQKYVVGFELEQLSAMLASARAALEGLPPGFGKLAQKHLEKAAEQHDDAITALRYNNPAQAETMLTDGLMHAYFAFRITHAKAVPAGRAGQEQATKDSEAEERIAYLGGALSELKAAIEYSRCLVSGEAGEQIEKAMQLYGEALTALKGNEQMLAKRTAQAGVLQLAFAGELIKADNGGDIQWGVGLANPLTNSPIRKMNQLAATILQVHIASAQQSAQVSRSLRSSVKKAIRSLNSAIRALAQDNVVYAQSLVVAGLAEIGGTSGLIEPTLDQAVAQAEQETLQLKRKFDAAEVELIASDIKSILERSDSRLADKASNRLDRLLKDYQAAVRAFEQGDRLEAERLVTAALTDADRVREALFNYDATLRFRLS